MAEPIEPWIQALIQSSGGAAAPQQELTLQDILRGTSMDVTGRRAMGGSALGPYLPKWYPVEKFNSLGVTTADVDPYLGVFETQTDDRVWFGTTKPKAAQKPILGREYAQGEGEDLGEAEPAGDKTSTVEAAVNMPFLWEQDEIDEAMEKMRAAGLPVKDFDDMTAVWQKMVTRASQIYSLSAGEKKVSPWDALDMYKSEAEKSGTLQALNRSEVRTATSVNELTEGQSWSVLRQTLSSMLGRDPSDQELRDYTYRMNSLAAKNPSISRTVTKYKDGEAVSSNTHSSGGFTESDAAEAAYMQAQNDPDYAEYQSATTYYNALQSALGPLGG